MVFAGGGCKALLTGMDFKFMSTSDEQLVKRIMYELSNHKSTMSWEVVCSFLAIPVLLSFRLSELEMNIARGSGTDFETFVRVAFPERVKRAEYRWHRDFRKLNVIKHMFFITIMLNSFLSLFLFLYLSLSPYLRVLHRPWGGPTNPRRMGGRRIRSRRRTTFVHPPLKPIRRTMTRTMTRKAEMRRVVGGDSAGKRWPRRAIAGRVAVTVVVAVAVL
jgi:hypothetical protein